MPRCSVVIVTWHCAALVTECLHSLAQQQGVGDIELIVIDNASADDTVTAVGQAWPGCVLVVNERNTGFAHASNQGMALARAPLLCLLNPDTVLPRPDTLRRLIERVEQQPAIDAAGVRLVFPDGSHQVGDAGYLPTLAAALAHAFLLTRPPLGLHGLFLQDGQVPMPWGRVGWVSGACTLLRRSTLERAGGLDASYFLYGEDVEWGCRMNRLGLTVAYLPDIDIVHVQGGTQKPSAVAPPTRWIDGLSRLYNEYNRGRHFATYRAAMATGFWLRALLCLARDRDRARTMAAFARHFWRQRAGPLPAHPG